MSDPAARRSGTPPAATRPRDSDLARLLRVPGDADHKYTRGVVELWAGSWSYPGAAVLTASAAVRAGAGMVRLLAPERVTDLVLAHRPEVVPCPGRSQCLVLGPGTDPDDQERAAEIRGALRAVLDASSPAVVDAGALALLPPLLREGRRCSGAHVLTPHAGEAAALLCALGRDCSRAEVEAAPLAAVTDLVTLTGATVLLKGTPTLIASADGTTVLSVDPGPGWLATAGSGDVLAGILGAVLAACQADEDNGRGVLDPVGCAAASVRIHALAGAHASGATQTQPGRPVAALDVAGSVPVAWARLDETGRSEVRRG